MLRVIILWQAYSAVMQKLQQGQQTNSNLQANLRAMEKELREERSARSVMETELSDARTAGNRLEMELKEVTQQVSRFNLVRHEFLKLPHFRADQAVHDTSTAAKSAWQHGCDARPKRFPTPFVVDNEPISCVASEMARYFVVQRLHIRTIRREKHRRCFVFSSFF